MTKHREEDEQHPAQDEPREHGEIPRKRDDSKDHRSDPWHPARERK